MFGLRLQRRRDYVIWGTALTLAAAALVCGFWTVRYAFAVNKLSQGIGQTMFYGSDGKPWFPLEDHRRDVPLARISPGLQRAVVAIEDHRFFSHPGIDPIGMAREPSATFGAAACQKAAAR